MLQMIIEGRGGQCAQMAGNLLADLFFQEGKHVLAYATYGGARRGTPVSSSLRVDEKPIRLRCNIENPDAVVCFDPSLLGSGHLLGVATEQTLVLINSSRGAEAFRFLGGFRVVTIDAMAIARRTRTSSKAGCPTSSFTRKNQPSLYPDGSVMISNPASSRPGTSL